jgi:hypothetical protein
MFKGFRTVLFNVAMTFVVGGTLTVSQVPMPYNEWLMALTIAWGIAGIALRLITTTPFGKKIEDTIEKDTGITQAQMDTLVARLPEGDIKDIPARITQLEAAVAQAKADTPTQETK